MSKAESPGDTHITFRAGQSRKQYVKMRAAQRGYDTVTEYLIDLVDEDLDEADLPDLE